MDQKFGILDEIEVAFHKQVVSLGEPKVGLSDGLKTSHLQISSTSKEQTLNRTWQRGSTLDRLKVELQMVRRKAFGKWRNKWGPLHGLGMGLWHMEEHVPLWNPTWGSLHRLGMGHW